jgi:phytoene dehydrogenase-like protein
MRVLPMPVAEWLDEWFESGVLKGALGAMGIRDLQQGARSAGTAFRLLHHHVGSPPGVFRPARSNIGQVLRSGIAPREGKAKRIAIRSGHIAGVVLGSGEEIAASLVVSGAGPRRLLELVEPGWLDPELVRALRNVRARGVVAKIKFELERTPDFRTLAIAPSLDYLERAYDHAKYGRVSTQPYLEIGADGEAHFQFAPYRLAEGVWDENRREALGDLAARLLKPYVAGVKARSVLAPPDLEAREGWPEGQAHHAELALDQALWMRPVPELARYRTPIEGLWLCGPGTHPGGGIVGASGYNCAREILSKL